MSEHVGGVEMMSEHVRRVGMTRFLDRHGEELPEPAQRVADHPAHLHPLCSARGRIPLHTHPAVAHHALQTRHADAVAALQLARLGKEVLAHRAREEHLERSPLSIVHLLSGFLRSGSQWRIGEGG